VPATDWRDEDRADLARAAARGQRVVDLADACLDGLVPNILPAARKDDARVVLFHVLADALYGTVAIDIPPLRRLPYQPPAETRACRKPE
jgi:hypothetical protein